MLRCKLLQSISTNSSPLRTRCNADASSAFAAAKSSHDRILSGIIRWSGNADPLLKTATAVAFCSANRSSCHACLGLGSVWWRSSYGLPSLAAGNGMASAGWSWAVGLVPPNTPAQMSSSCHPRCTSMLQIEDDLTFLYDDTLRGPYGGFHWLCWRPSTQLQNDPDGMAALLQQPILQVNWDTGKLLRLPTGVGYRCGLLVPQRARATVAH